MNNTSPNEILGEGNVTVEALQEQLRIMTQRNALLEEKYAELSKQHASVTSLNTIFKDLECSPSDLLSLVESSVYILRNLSNTLDESLAHNWAVANNPYQKIASKLTKLLNKEDADRLHRAMTSLDGGKEQISKLLDDHYKVLTPRDIRPDSASPSLPEKSEAPFDVLFFGTIDYDYLFQRPQHFASHLAAAGHRVFYINTAFPVKHRYTLKQQAENLYLVNLPCFTYDDIYTADLQNTESELYVTLKNMLFEQNITNAVVVVDHPNWVHPVLHLKQLYNFPIITDYLDDYTGFDQDDQDLIKNNAYLLLESSDLVVASSLYLQNKALELNDNVTLIRNGTDFRHFHTAYTEASANERKTIGYYGVVSSWFDYGKIKHLSARFPQHDIVLIGDVLESKREYFSAMPNVQLAGVKPYTELPNYLKTFDVCLIPFDSSLELIKATNPVKFYEYLSAAKKVVATELPELEPFRDRYVYLANDDNRFGDYVELCLNGSDTLADAAECMAFAEENDWKHRAKCFEEAADALFSHP